MSEKHSEERYWDYKWIRYIIKKRRWCEWNYIYNTYIVIWKDKKELFEKYILDTKEYKIIESSPIRYRYEYEKLDIPFSWWITFYERCFNQIWECVSIKIWNDYDHIRNWDETFDSVKQDVFDVIDFLVTSQE